MDYYIKRLGHQELGSVKNGKASRGRYIYISKDDRVLSLFPPLSRTVKNDSSVIPLIPLYQNTAKKIYCNYIYHNDKFASPPGSRNEYRIYSNNALEEERLLFREGDILIFRPEDASQIEVTNDSDLETAVESSKVYFLFLCSDRASELYRQCDALIKDSTIRGSGHAVYQGTLDNVEEKIAFFQDRRFRGMETVIDETVTAKAQAGDMDAMSSLFNSVSFRDFVMTGYEYQCAVTGSVIRYKDFTNLEAAHIWPRSHRGQYMPSNGIALSRDMHWAFDKGIFTVTDNLRIKVHPDVDSAYMKQYDNKQLFIPKNDFFRPDINNLHYHQQNIYGLFKTAGSLVKAPGYRIMQD